MWAPSSKFSPFHTHPPLWTSAAASRVERGDAFTRFFKVVPVIAAEGETARARGYLLRFVFGGGGKDNFSEMGSRSLRFGVAFPQMFGVTREDHESGV